MSAAAPTARRTSRRPFQLLLNTHGEGGAVLQQAVPFGTALLVVAFDLQSQSRRGLKVVADEAQPGVPGGVLELRLVRIQYRHEIALTPRNDRRDVEVPAHGVDG